MATLRASNILPNYRTLISLIPLSVAVGASLSWKFWFSGHWRTMFYHRDQRDPDPDPDSESQHAILQAHRHPTYWFDDGSLIVEVPKRPGSSSENAHSNSDLVLFKIHDRLFRRHSVYAQRAGVERGEAGAGTDNNNMKGVGVGVGVMTIPSELGVQVNDFTRLLEHLYHDTPLSPQSPFHHIAGILRISSPNQLDLPSIHGLARSYLETMFPSGPAPFVHPNCLEEAIRLSVQYKIVSIQKGIYYSLVTTTDFEPDATEGGNGHLELGAASDSNPTRTDHQVLSAMDIERCRNLMAGIVDHFTPVLFEPPVTPHMTCTNLLADKWFPLVVQSAIAGDSVYKPLEALEKMKEMDWVGEGLCEGCVREKREEWTKEQVDVWERMDSWLKLDVDEAE